MRNSILALCSVLWSAGTFGEPAMVKGLGQLPLFKDVTISPDGKRIAYFQLFEDKYVLVNRGLENDSPPNIYGLKEGRLRNYTWVGDRHMLVSMSSPFFSRADHERFTLWRRGLLNVETNEMQSPFNEPKFVYFVHGPYLVNPLPKDPDHILMRAFSRRKTQDLHGNTRLFSEANLYKVNLHDGDLERLERSDDLERDWISNDDGEILLRREFDSELNSAVWTHRATVNDDFERLAFEDEGELYYFTGNVLGTDPAVKYLYYIDYADNDRKQVRRGRLEGGRLVDRKIAGRSERYEVDDIIVNYHNQGVVGTVHDEDLRHYRYLDRNFAQVQANLEATFPDNSVNITSFTRDLKQFAIELSGPALAPKYYLYKIEEGSLTELADAYPGVDAAQLSPVQRFDYSARDGLQVEAYLTLPRDKEPSNLPLVLLPHGGPHARDNMDFDWMRQFYASQGYAVFQPNFRGSAGFGLAFKDAGREQWGAAMQNDLYDGVDALIEEGYVDSERICVVGASYGGYAALMAVIQKPEQYRCAATFAPVTDLSEMINHSYEQGMDIDYWVDSIGSRFDLASYRSLSPVYLISRTTPPVLIMHGDQDTVVPPGQSFKLSRALKKAGNPDYRYIELDDEDHWMTLQSSREAFLRESAELLKANIGN